MITIVKDCNNSALDCGMTITSSLYAFIVMIFSFVCIIKMWTSTLNLKFESLALVTTFIQSLLQFIQNFFVDDIRILLSSQFVQAITFSFVATSFTQLYFRANILKPHKDQQTKKIIMRIFIAYKLLIIGVAIYVLASLKRGDCYNWFSWSYYIPLSLSGISMLVSLFFGIGLYRKINKENVVDLEQKNQDSEYFQVQKKGHLYLLLQKQVRSILITYLITTLAQIVLNVINEYSVEPTLICSNDYIFTSLKNESQVFLFFFSIVEITPCLIIPYVFYYIPFSKAKMNKNHEDLIFTIEVDDCSDEDSSTSNSRHQSSLQYSLCEENQISINEDDFQRSQIICAKVVNNQSNMNESNRNTKENFGDNTSDNTPPSQPILNISKSNSNYKRQHESQEYEEGYIPDRFKRSTIDGMAALNYGFKISDYKNKHQPQNDE